MIGILFSLIPLVVCCAIAIFAIALAFLLPFLNKKAIENNWLAIIKINEALIKIRFMFLSCFLFLVLGMLLLLNAYNTFSHYEIAGITADVTGRVCYTQKTDEIIYLHIDNVEIEAFNAKYELNSKTLVKIKNSVDEFRTVDIGDIIVISGDIYSEPFTKNQWVNSFASASGVKYVVEDNGEIAKFTHKKAKANEIARQKVYNILNDNLKGDAVGVAYGMIVGDTEYISKSAVDSFRISGLSHIFSVSGLHVGFLTLMIDKIFSMLKQNCYVRLVFLVLAYAIYLWFVGFSASMVRACIMFLFIYVGKVVGRNNDVLTSFAAAFLLILMVSPLALFEVSFQMSFSVMFTIILLSKLFSGVARKIPKMFSSIFTSFSAQIGIIPISTWYFSSISVYSIIINVLLIPLFSIMFMYALLATILVWIMPFMGFIFLPLDFLLFSSICISNLFAAIPFSNIQSLGFGVAVIIYYLIIVVCSNFVMLKTKIKQIAVLVLAFVFLSSVLIMEIPQKPSKDGVVFVGGNYDQNILIEGKQGDRVLICKKIGSGFPKELVSYLKEKRIKQIDSMVVLNAYDNFYERYDDLKSEKINIKTIHLPFSDNLGVVSDAFALNLLGVSVNMHNDVAEIGFNNFSVNTLGDEKFKVVEVSFKKSKVLIASALTNDEYSRIAAKNVRYDVICADNYIVQLAIINKCQNIISFENVSHVDINNYKSIQRYGTQKFLLLNS